jgi:hypothetical protein
MISINILFACVFFAILTTYDYTGKRLQYIFDGTAFSFNVAAVLLFIST